MIWGVRVSVDANRAEAGQFALYLESWMGLRGRLGAKEPGSLYTSGREQQAGIDSPFRADVVYS